MALSGLKEKLESVVEDLATLEVATFTGETVEGLDSVDSTSSKEIFSTIRGQLTSATLVGYSRYELEGDVISYVNSDLGEEKKYLLDNHATLVEGGQKSRKELFDFFLSVLK